MHTLKTLALAEAEDIANRAIETAGGDGGDPIAVCVVGVDGNIIVAKTMDGCKAASIAVAANKAWTCIRMQKDTIEYAKRQPPLDSSNVGDPRISFFAGGVLVVDSMAIIGAVGVSGRQAYREQNANYAYNTDHELASLGEEAFVPK